ncbi:MAG TPA: MFS transporter [Bryobacteraceae bacterium]|jgi:YNFM family putative membrane transporter|nr:MFS transporter [Bryobacteraceae bacterium]
MASTAHLTQPMPHQTRDSRTRTAAVVCAGFCAFLALFAPQPLLPMLGAAFGASAASVSLVLTASTMAVAIAAPLAGIIADRLGRKRVMVPAAFLLVVPTVLAATSQTLGQLLFWRFLQGALTPGIFAVTIAYINEEWVDGAGATVAAYVTGTVLGGFSGRMLAGVVAAHSSWRWAFVMLGVLNALGAVAIWRWLPPGKRFTHARRGSSSLGPMLRHLKNPRLLATYAVGFCVMFTMLAAFTYVNFYLAAPPFRLGTQALAMIFVVYLVGAVITPFAGRLIDRMGHRAAVLIAFSGGIAGISLTLLHSLPAVITGLAIFCTGVFIANSAGSSYIGVVAHEARAAAVGLYVTFYYTGGSFGSALPGSFWSRGGWPACVALIAVVQLLAIAMALLFWRPSPLVAPAVLP